MRIKFIYYFFFILVFYACDRSTHKDQNIELTADSTVIIKKPFEDNPNIIEYEFSVLKGTSIKQGIQKRYYRQGSIYSEIPYENGKREGIAYTYYPGIVGVKSSVWKKQPYKNGKLDGICKRYYRNGALQSEYEYKNGIQALGLKEFNTSGKPVKFPDLVISYSKMNDYYFISAHLTSNVKDVNYYDGKLVENKYFPENLKGLQVRNEIGEELIPFEKKSVTITATYFTRYQNRVIISKTIQMQ